MEIAANRTFNGEDVGLKYRKGESLYSLALLRLYLMK